MKRVRVGLLTLVITTFLVTGLVAQSPGGALGSQNLRAYWHVFAAYAIAWVLIGGWVISISRRLGALEQRPRE